MERLICRWPWWAAWLSKWLCLRGHMRAANWVLAQTGRLNGQRIPAHIRRQWTR